jgi:hypothetical protein
MVMKLAWIPVFFCVCAYADAIKLHSVDPASTPDQLYVQFETPVALNDADIQFSASPGNCAPMWDVVVTDSTGSSSKPCVTAALNPVGHLSSLGLVTLTINPALPANFSRVDVTFRKGENPHVSFNASKKPKKLLVSPAKSRDDADVYISGSVAPAVGSGPTYSIDSNGKYIIRSLGQTGATTLSAVGDIKTDNRPTADPDSFHWGIPIQHVSANWYAYQWSTIGMDFDKKAQAMNLVSAPNFTFILNHDFKKPDPKINGVDDIVASIGLNLTVGAEFGDNLRNDFAVVNKNDKGETPFFRGVPAISAGLVIPQILHLNKISVTSNYTARILTRDELFLETRNTKDPIPKLTSGTRNYLENNIQFMFTEYAGFQIKHKFGTLPPAFKFVNHSVSIGLVFQFKETRVP